MFKATALGQWSMLGLMLGTKAEDRVCLYIWHGIDFQAMKMLVKETLT